MDAAPVLDDLLERLHVVALPMRVRFRGITVREVALIDGPAGWGEFGAFGEYGAPEAAAWLAASAVELMPGRAALSPWITALSMAIFICMAASLEKVSIMFGLD